MPILTTNIISKMTETHLGRLWSMTGGMDSYLLLPMPQRMEWVANSVVNAGYGNTGSSNENNQVNSFKLNPLSLNVCSANHVPPCATQLRIAGLNSMRIR